MQPYFTLCVGAAASGTVYDDMSLLSRVVIDMTHVPAVRVGVFFETGPTVVLEPRAPRQAPKASEFPRLDDCNMSTP